MTSPEKPPQEPFTARDWAILLAIVALFAVGVYLGCRTWSNMGGIRGYLALAKRMLQEVGILAGSFVAYVVCFAMFHALFSLLTGTRLRRIRIFVSFKHDYESIATELEQVLDDRDTEVIRLPFRSQRDHDDVIAESLAAVGAADAVVVVPGPEPSWMANELGHAVGSGKPVVVIKHLPDQSLSDSLYRGYPVFDWQRVRHGGFVPLRRFLAFAAKSRGDVWPQFRRCLASFGSWVGTSLIFLILFNAVVTFVVKILWAFVPRAAELITVGWLRLIVLLLALAFAVGFSGALVRRIRGLAVARQKIRTRSATFAEFEEVFDLVHEDRQILNALEREPLRPRHGST